MSLRDELERKRTLLPEAELTESKRKAAIEAAETARIEAIKKDARYVAMEKVARSPIVHEALNLYVQKKYNPEREIGYDDLSSEIQIEVTETLPTPQQMKDLYFQVFTLEILYPSEGGLHVSRIEIGWQNHAITEPGENPYFNPGSKAMHMAVPDRIIEDKGMKITVDGRKFNFHSEKTFIDYLTDVIVGLK